ncbi:MAG: N-acetylneuraminic acid synthase [Chlorobiaceae bacterium]|nr:N-acetylneuraminic acid synthase [Chlorobiaceae bacterium]
MIKFIAEVSSNHHRDLDRSFEFIRATASAGCQAVKFQLFKIDRLFAPEILERSEKHRRRKEWELPLEFLPELAACAKTSGIEFSCTPFYLEAVQELEPYVDFYKVASYELLWEDLLASCAATGKPVILSTGMATMEEINRAVDVLRRNGCPEPVLLHCTSAYPTPYGDANLSAIETLRRETGCAVGWSDHTVEPAVIQRAVHRWGAQVVEFHLDLDGQGEEYGAGHCWLPGQIAEVIGDVRKGLDADGSGVKEPVASELPDRLWRADPLDGLRPMKQIRGQWR